MELLVGAGRRHERLIAINGDRPWNKLVTLDINPDHKPDVVWDLTKRPLPFDDDTFDEIHAYEVLEHLGTQGDWRAWFGEWSEWWRILKPGGVIVGTSPSWDNVWAWGDPGHTRVMTTEAFTYLSQAEYTKQIGVTAMTDYRFVFRGDFDLVYANTHEGTLQFGLQAVKPSRISI
jgi:SAM-dependent methyltransferase